MMTHSTATLSMTSLSLIELSTVVLFATKNLKALSSVMLSIIFFIVKLRVIMLNVVASLKRVDST
jgi:hypothetical protein